MPRPGRTPLFQQLQRTLRKARCAEMGIDPRGRTGISRRALLAGATAGILAAYTPSARAKANGPTVAIVGAGIAGLHATYLLAQAGYDVTLYEGSDHIGGRIQTNYNGVADGVYTELGGEFIDSDHADMLHLAKLFDLSLIDTQAPSEAGLQVAYYAKGKLHSEEEVIKAFAPLAAILNKQSAKLSNRITYDHHSAFDASLDNTSLAEYLQAYEKTGWLSEVLEAAYVNEFGLDLQQQSSLNFVETIGTDTTNGFEIYGLSDQRYKIQGGNSQIIAGLADAVADNVELGHVLESITLKSNGKYQLNFDLSQSSNTSINADVVILALPFSILRNVVINVPLPAIKTKAIQQLGYGANAKLILGFQSRVWRSQGFDGDSYADLPYQSGWDSSRQQPTTLGAYTIYPGGTAATDLAPGTALDQANRLFPGLNQVFPGLQQQWLGTALRAYWPSNPFILASYASYLTGQWTSIRGAEPLAVGNLHFAGEHTSLNWQGYMNGGAESGRRAAAEVMG